MYRGYVALWRKIQNHDFYKERREFSKFEAWVDILMEVQHSEEPQQVTIGMKCLICNYGESLKSVRTWATRWGWSESKVYRFLKLLEKMAQIETQSETITTRIKVLNYYQYDPKRIAKETQKKRSRSGDETHSMTDKNDKNDKNDNNVYIIPFLGEFKNVKLTNNELSKLKDRFHNYKEKIESLSLGIESKGYKYKSHYATILTWERRNNKSTLSKNAKSAQEFINGN